MARSAAQACLQDAGPTARLQWGRSESHAPCLIPEASAAGASGGEGSVWRSISRSWCLRDVCRRVAITGCVCGSSCYPTEIGGYRVRRHQVGCSGLTFGEGATLLGPLTTPFTWRWLPERTSQNLAQSGHRQEVASVGSGAVLVSQHGPADAVRVTKQVIRRWLGANGVAAVVRVRQLRGRWGGQPLPVRAIRRTWIWLVGLPVSQQKKGPLVLRQGACGMSCKELRSNWTLPALARNSHRTTTSRSAPSTSNS